MPYDVPMTLATLGRRESKKRATRESLVAAAMKLFAERGYQGTTVADIAASAGVAPRTFFGYFPTKEAVLFVPLDALARDLEHTLATSTDDALTTLRAWAHRHASWFNTDFRELRDLIEASARENHTVAVTGLMFSERFAQAVAARMRLDLGSAGDDPLPDMAAAAAVAALTVALPLGTEVADGQVRRSEHLLADLDTAINFVRAGLAA